MDRAAISVLQRGMDQSWGGGVGGSSEGNTKAAFCFVLCACLSLSFLIIMSIWKYVFVRRVQPKTLLNVQRPKKTTLIAWPSFINTDMHMKLT